MIGDPVGGHFQGVVVHWVSLLWRTADPPSSQKIIAALGLSTESGAREEEEDATREKVVEWRRRLSQASLDMLNGQSNPRHAIETIADEMSNHFKKTPPTA